jgi:hypothetical protein
MSGFETAADATALPSESKDRGLQGRSLRFTPLRSHVLRARALTRETREELVLTRLIPTPRLQT